MATFADRLRALRAERKLRQSDLADHLHVSDATIGYWESGRSSPGIDIVQRVAEYFDVSMDYITGKTDYRKVEVPAERLTEPLAILMRGDLKRLPPEAQNEIAEYIKLLQLKYDKK